MALSDLSFKLYTDSSLTSVYGGTTTLTHESDLSDNPQDLQLWFGSTNATRKLEAQSNPGVDQVSLTPTDILPEWVASTAYSLGDTAEPTVDNTYRYTVTTAGTSAASEPTWPTSIGSTVVDGTVTWTCIAKTHQPTEIKLASTAAGLDAAVAGDPLNLGASITGGVAGAVEVNVRITNAVTEVSTNAGHPELALFINSVIESVV